MHALLLLAMTGEGGGLQGLWWVVGRGYGRYPAMLKTALHREESSQSSWALPNTDVGENLFVGAQNLTPFYM